MNLLEAYRYLVALDEHRHFGRAATACHITQPALSNALRSLEEFLGCTLVVRGRSFERFTDEGLTVLLSAHRMMREQENLRQELRANLASPQGTLLLAAVPTALPVATRFAARLLALYPRIQPQVRSLSSQAIEAGLDALSIDLGLGYPQRVEGKHPLHQDLSKPHPASRWAVIDQWTESYYLVRRRPDSTQTPGSQVTWVETAKERLALLSREMYNRLIVDAAFASVHVSLQPVLETNSVLALQVAVTEGGMAAVLPGAMLSTIQRWPELLVQRLIEPEIGTPIGFMHNPQSPPGLVLQTALRLAASAQWLEEVQTMTQLGYAAHFSVGKAPGDSNRE